MAKVQKTIKLNAEVYQAAEAWMQQSGGIFNLSTLTEVALRKFITEAQTLDPVTLSDDDALKLANKAMGRHKKALDRMK